MKNYLLFKILSVFLQKYISIFLLATILIFTSITKNLAEEEENVFTVTNVEIKGPIDINFSRNKYINTAFLNSFEILMTKILLTRDLEKVENVELKKIKNLIKSFQILNESYLKNEYQAKIKIIYNEIKVKKFLGEKNISFSQPENISALFFPVLFVENETKNFNDNIFYQKWNEIKIKNELINFILPIEDIEDISSITKMKNNIEKINVANFVDKYDVKNYVFALIDYRNSKLNIHLKTNFNNNKISKNIKYDLQNFEDNLLLESIIKDLKIKVTDLWKEENLLNLLMPLSIKVKFEHKNINKFHQLKESFYKITIIDDFDLEQFDINSSFFKIYYYGNPKKLKSELFKFGYKLENNQGFWQIYLNE